MKQPEVVFDLVNDPAGFTSTIEYMMDHQKDDNILFYRDREDTKPWLRAEKLNANRI